MRRKQTLYSDITSCVFQREEEKARRLQRDKELQEVAVSHHQGALLRSHGLQPWKKLMAQSRRNMARAASHHSSALLGRSLRLWSLVAGEMAAEKRRRAERLCNTILLRRSFRCWMKYKDLLSVQEAGAVHWYSDNVKRRMLIAWLDVTQDAKITMWEKQRSAAEHNQRRILSSALRIWRQFPKRMKELKLKEERLDSLRKRVAELLPDFGAGGDTPK
ncbi:coiled-coil domain-containing protein 191-like [Mantella aurantiaca]